MATSQNGYRANDRGVIKQVQIPGTVRKVSLHEGPTGELLAEWAAWYDKNIEDIEGGVYDDWGYAERPIRGSTTTLSNHASGTAIDLNATKHPLGRRGTLNAKQTAAIRKELKNYEGAIRWGGDYHNRADEMHYEINANEQTVKRVLAKVRAQNSEAGMNEVQLFRRDIAAALNKHGYKIGKDRRAARAMASAIRAALAAGPKK